MKLLVIEDEVMLNKSIVKLLKTQQYSVDAAYDGEEALDYIRATNYDVIISDIMMPRLDGLGVLKYLRNHQIKTPVLMLTAKDALEDKVTGLDAGADDYLVKPFEFDELLARIRVMLRRNNREILMSTVQFGDYCLDFIKKTVTKNSSLVDLTSKEYALLECLVRHPNVILSREQIREHIWDFDYEGEFTNVRKYNDDGDRIEYTVKEADASGYTVKVTGTQEDGFTVTNTEIPPSTPGPKTPKSRLTPKTGDSNDIGMYGLILLSAITVTGGLLMRRKSL